MELAVKIILGILDENGDCSNTRFGIFNEVEVDALRTVVERCEMMKGIEK